MRVPSFERMRRLSAFGAFWVCGMVVGAAAFNGLHSEAYNRVILENYELAQRIDLQKEELSRLKSDLGKESVIQGVRVFIVTTEGKPPIDVVTEQELKKRLKDDLAGFRGRSVYRIGEDAQLTRRLLEKKIYTDIGGSDYAVKIDAMLVADGLLQVWAEASLHLRP